MSGNEVIRDSVSRFSAIQAEALFYRMPFKVNILFKIKHKTIDIEVVLNKTLSGRICLHSNAKEIRKNVSFPVYPFKQTLLS